MSILSRLKGTFSNIFQIGTKLDMMFFRQNAVINRAEYKNFEGDTWKVFGTSDGGVLNAGTTTDTRNFTVDAGGPGRTIEKIYDGQELN